MKLLIRVLLYALALFYALPAIINGIAFHGNFFQAIALGAGFALMLWLVEVVASFLSGVFAVGTLGLGLLILVPMWLFGFWLLPAVALKYLSDLAPHYLTVSGWAPAIGGGIIMFLITMFTGGFSSGRARSNR